MDTGKLIVIEGLDGTGKTTQLQLLAAHLRAQGKTVHTDAEPTGGETGKLLRRVLSGEVPCSPWATAALFLADRIEHNTRRETGILQRLQAGHTVLTDRYYYSTLAYQGLDTDVDWVLDMHRRCPVVRMPDLVLYLHMSPEKCMERIRRNRPEEDLEIFETTETLTAVGERFDAVFSRLKKTENIVPIDADGSIEAVAARIAEAADRIFTEDAR